MIVRTISVVSWRCYVDPVNIGPFQEGLNILYGPNATGKSTIFEALLRCLLDGHGVRGREIDSIRSWGRSLAPTVTVEFTNEGIDYRIMKQFLDGASSKLERKENGRFVALAQNNDADDMVRNILTRNAPGRGRGLARPENWGIAQVLWAPQGNLAFGKLSGDLLADIRTSLGAQVSGPSAGLVENRIEDIYLQIFTAGGKLKTGKEAPAIVNLREKLEEAKCKCNTALSEQQQFEEAGRRVEDLRARRNQAKYYAETITKTLQECRSQAESYRGLLSEKVQREEKRKAAEAQHTGVKERIEQIEAARGELKTANGLLHELEETTPLQVLEIQSREKEAADSKAVLEDARKERQAVDDAREIAEQARNFLENSGTLTDLKGAIQKITHAQEDLALLKKERSDLVAPDVKDLRAIRKVIKKRDECRVLIDASLITLEIVPKTESSLEVLSGESIGKVSLHPETPTRIKGSPEVAAELSGVARLRAWGPTGSIEEHRKQHANAKRKLKSLTDFFNTDDLAELEALGEKAEALDKQLIEIEIHLQTFLSGRSFEEILQERSRVDTTRAKAFESHPNWRKNKPNSEALKIKAQESSRIFVEKMEEAETRWETAQFALTAATKRGAELGTHLEATRTQIKSTESRLAGFIIDSKSDEERETELKKIALAWEAAGAGLEKVENKLLAYGDDPVATVAKLEKQFEAADETASKALGDEKTEEGRLQNLSSRGTYSTLALAEEEITALETQIESEQLRVNMIRLIYDTVVKCRSEALSAVVGPVEVAATRILQRIAGERLGPLRFGNSFEPDHVTPGIFGSSVSIDNVSGGEKEQIHLATRLALAEVLAKEERQLVVLDDVLLATDAGRLARVMTILEESAQRLQIFILTCHPERYRGLEGANFMDLEAITRGETSLQ